MKTCGEAEYFDSHGDVRVCECDFGDVCEGDGCWSDMREVWGDGFGEERNDACVFVTGVSREVVPVVL